MTETCRITVYRTGVEVAAPYRGLVVRVDGKRVGRVWQGEEISTAVSPGQHRVVAHLGRHPVFRRSPLLVYVEPGDHLRIEVEARWTSLDLYLRPWRVVVLHPIR